jgi:hypothetical protein
MRITVAGRQTTLGVIRWTWFWFSQILLDSTGERIAFASGGIAVISLRDALIAVPFLKAVCTSTLCVTGDLLAITTACCFHVSSSLDNYRDIRRLTELDFINFTGKVVIPVISHELIDGSLRAVGNRLSVCVEFTVVSVFQEIIIMR